MKNSKKKKPSEALNLDRDWADLKGLPPLAYVLLKEESQLAFAVIRVRIVNKTTDRSATYVTEFDEYVYMSDAWTNEMANNHLNPWVESHCLPPKKKYAGRAYKHHSELLWTGRQVQKAIHELIKEMRKKAHDRIEAIKEVMVSQNQLIDTYASRQASLYNEPYLEMTMAMPTKKGGPEGTMPRTFYRQGGGHGWSGRRLPMPKFRPR